MTMTTNEKTKFTDDTKLADLTVGEFKTMIRVIVEDIVQQAVFELEQELPDPDAGLKLRPEIVRRLWKSTHEKPEGKPIEDVVRELGLDE
jgi:hypothetical protein